QPAGLEARGGAGRASDDPLLRRGRRDRRTRDLRRSMGGKRRRGRARPPVCLGLAKHRRTRGGVMASASGKQSYRPGVPAKERIGKVEKSTPAGLRPGARRGGAQPSQPKAPPAPKTIPPTASTVPVTQKTVVPGKSST